MAHAPSNLVQRMLEGDRTCFDDIIRLYSGDVFRLSYSLLWNKEEAEDVLQEAMLRLVRSIKNGRFRGENGSIKGFLVTSARNLCIDRLRKRSLHYSRREEVRSFDETLREPRMPDEEAHEAHVRSAFEDALQHLTDTQRTVLVLHDLNEESFEKIADALHLSVNGVRTHLCRARRKMRLLLAPFVDES
ncbi:MAG: RNA polymerase sigma factor [bacterium]